MRAGEILGDRFRIEAHAGEGAMGTVLRARDVATGQHVAVKVLRQGRAHEARFAREAEALARVRGPGVVRYVHHGIDGEGRPFLAMEWIDGPSLDQRLERGGLHALDALRLAERLARALHEVHAVGVVHRDLKPSNVMLPGDSLADACIVDFGLAKLGGERTAITTARGQLGTPRYMAPEQIQDPSAVDARADVFALGCVLFECLTGAPAFGAADPIAVIAQILFQPAPEPSALVPQLPDAVDRLLERLLARDAAARPSALELADALARMTQPEPARELAAVPRPGRSTPPTPPPLQRPPTDPTAVASEPPLRLSSERLSVLDVAPRADGALIGRAAELAAVRAQLAEGMPVALWGGPGVGKTRLALELMRTAPERCARLFVDLSFASSTEEAVRSVAEHAGLRLPPAERPELVLSALLGKLGRVLLVLDRVEALAGSIEPLLRLLCDHGPRLQVIATSRLRLQLPSAIELHGLSTEPPAGDGQLRLSPAASLLLSRARDAVPSLPALEQLAPGSAASLERVAGALEGNPLAIELAAARASVLGLDGLAARISRPMTLLSGAASDPIREALEQSLGELDAHAYRALLQCAVFQGSFELDAAEAVVAQAPGAPSLAMQLQSLREHSLLVARSSAGEGHLRLSLPATVRELALERCASLEPHTELAGAATRHMRYFAGLASRSLARPGDAALRARLVRGKHNVLAALRCALELSSQGAALGSGAAFVLLRALEPMLLARGPGGELARQLDRALELSSEEAAPELREARLAVRQLRARLLAPAGQLERSFAELRAVIEAARALGARSLEASALLDLGVTHHFARELAAARACYERALDLLAQGDDVIGEARCVGNLAALAHDRAELHEALASYRRAIALLEEQDEPRLLANFWGNRALCEHELGQPALAAESYRRALALLEPLGDARLLGIVLSNDGTLVLEQDGAAAALPLQQRACALLQGAGDARSEALARGRRAVVHARLGSEDDAERDLAYAERALRRDPIGAAVVALFRGFLELARAEHAAVKRRLELVRGIDGEGVRLLEQCDDLRLYARLLEAALSTP